MFNNSHEISFPCIFLFLDSYPLLFFLGISKQLSDVGLWLAHIFVQNLWPVDHLRLSGIQHLTNLARHQGFTTTRRPKQQDPLHVFTACGKSQNQMVRHYKMVKASTTNCIRVFTINKRKSLLRNKFKTRQPHVMWYNQSKKTKKNFPYTLNTCKCTQHNHFLLFDLLSKYCCSSLPLMLTKSAFIWSKIVNHKISLRFKITFFYFNSFKNCIYSYDDKAVFLKAITSVFWVGNHSNML